MAELIPINMYKMLHTMGNTTPGGDNGGFSNV